MLTSLFGRLRTRTRIALTLLLCLGLLSLSAILLPSRSGAKQQQQPSQATDFSKQRFVPGEVIVRYRTEATAQSKTGRLMVATREGRQLPAQVERSAVLMSSGDCGKCASLRKTR